jgi:hypothetical protein
MEIGYTTDAFASLLQLVNFIESRNTEGAGLRWLNKYEIFLQKSLSTLPVLKFAITKPLRS